MVRQENHFPNKLRPDFSLSKKKVVEQVPFVTMDGEFGGPWVG